MYDGGVSFIFSAHPFFDLNITMSENCNRKSYEISDIFSSCRPTFIGQFQKKYTISRCDNGQKKKYTTLGSQVNRVCIRFLTEPRKTCNKTFIKSHESTVENLVVCDTQFFFVRPLKYFACFRQVTILRHFYRLCSLASLNVLYIHRWRKLLLDRFSLGFRTGKFPTFGLLRSLF